MEQKRISFEAALKEKLAMKTSSFTTEQATLQKMFRYFDLNNNGRVDPKEFKKTIEKIGVVHFSDEDSLKLFQSYDADGSGYLDYKEFGSQLFGHSISPSPTKSTGKAPTQPGSQVATLQQLLLRIRKILASRGARSIFGLGRQFRIMDNNRSRSLDYNQFSQALRDYQLGCTVEQYNLLFNNFDRNHDGSVDYNEFLRQIRGPLSQKRKEIVHRAFKTIDKDGSGILNIQDIKGTYNAKMHPDVKAGKKTEQQVLLQFLDTFEQHHNENCQVPGDKNVTIEEFEEYYSNISASCQNDEYFELMMANAWKMDVGDYHGSRSYGKAWSNNQGASGATPLKDSYSSKHPAQASRQAAQGAFPGHEAHTAPAGSRDVQSLLQRFRKSLSQRGARGIIGLSRQFRIMDDNHSLTLDWNEYIKACHDFRVTLPDADLKTLFGAFDVNNDGTVSYDEFLRAVRGPMSPIREKIVREAFSKLDKTGDGQVDINDIKGVYNARNHPQVRAGRKSEDEILSEFLNTFETHHYIRSGSGKDSVVTWDQFKQYYENVGSSIDDDRYFELMMVNSWKLRGTDKPVQAAWSNMKAGGGAGGSPQVSQMAPFGTSSRPTDYSTNMRPMSSNTQGGPSSASAAGVSTWPMMGDGANGQNYAAKSDGQLVGLFRQKLSKRGVRGMLGMQRTFKIIDDDGSLDLSMTEFKKAIRDYRIPVNEKDAERLFTIFDVDRSNSIDYSEFIRQVRGKMNEFRRNMVKKAFKIMDKTGDGALQIDDVRQSYNASLHPDVRAGKKTEEEVLSEFLDTFELQYNLSKGLPPKGDDKVTLDEFMEYYENVSANIDNDLYFELMMNRVWNLDNSRVTKKGWGGQV